MLLNAIFVILVPSKVFSSVIFNNLNVSSSTSIPVASYLVLSVLSIQWFNYNAMSVIFNNLTIMTFQYSNYNALLFCMVSLMILY